MKKLVFLFYISLICITFACVHTHARPNNEVILTTDDEVTKLTDTCDLDLTCVDSIDYKNGYYWCIYSNPDQFETDLCISMDKNTYNKLFDTLYELSKYKVIDKEYSDILENNHFIILYGNSEYTILTRKD